ncbi:MAG: 6-phosphogluconolactonase [Bacteroidota bacterium]|nr:6-phosphogluconolactonase [Bacteroidota bacterium]
MFNSQSTIVKVYRTLDELSHAAAEEFVRCAKEAIAQWGRFAVALSGGNTPRTLYELLERDYAATIDWRRAHFFWGDERYVPHTDPQSNFRLAKETMLDALHIPVENIHPMPTHFSDPDEAAHEYEAELRFFFSGRPGFDLMLQGIGTDGHTASLFPGNSALREKKAWVVAVHADMQPPVRLSLTLPVINAARNIFFIAAGEEKRHVIEAMLDHSEDEQQRYPVARVRTNGKVFFFLDEEARGGKR